MLTNAAVKAARPRAAAYKLADRRGLHLYIAPTGLKSFRWRFRLNGRELLLTIGSWPDVSLDAARARCDQAREQLGRGEDPRTSGPDAPMVRRFEDAARAWHAHQRQRWTDVHAGDVMSSLERDIFPAIGAMPLAAITSPVVLAALRAIEDRGSIETARRIRQRIGIVFDFARAEGWTGTNPAEVVLRALAPAPAGGRQPAIVNAAELRQLLASTELLDAPAAVKLASRFLALTAVRLAAVRGARWSEIEDLDGAEPIWRVPAVRMKLAAAKKLDAANDHIIPLSATAVAVLRAARALSCDIPCCRIFPGAGDLDTPIGEGAIGRMYNRAGYAGRHVPHGWRASFSTILNERLPSDRGAIDRALGHCAKTTGSDFSTNQKVEAAYNRSLQLTQRRRLFDIWAEILNEM